MNTSAAQHWGSETSPTTSLGVCSRREASGRDYTLDWDEPIFADGDPAGVAAVEGLATAGRSVATVIWVGKPDAAAAKGVSGAIEAMIVDFDEEVGRTACERVRPDLAPVANILATMKALKGSIGQTLADVLIERYGDFHSWPLPMQKLIQAIDGVLS